MTTDDRILLMLEPDGAMRTRTIDAARFWIGRDEPVGSEKNCIGTVAVILRVVEGKEATDDERVKMQYLVELISQVVRTVANVPSASPTKEPKE